MIYFSLGALPLFGLGEALIPADETARRQYAFWLMALYVGSGLGLLLTTCFLSLRRYLRQRRLRMPAAMTFAWLSAGGGLIVALLVIGAAASAAAGIRPDSVSGAWLRKTVGLKIRHARRQFGQGRGQSER